MPDELAPYQIAKRGDLFAYRVRTSSGKIDGSMIEVWRLGRVVSVSRSGYVKGGEQYCHGVWPGIYGVPSFHGCQIASQNLFDRPVREVLESVPVEYESVVSMVNALKKFKKPENTR